MNRNSYCRFLHTDELLSDFMAADLVLDWQNLLRDSLDNTHYAVNDLMLLDVATKMGAVDADTKEPLTEKYRKLSDVPNDLSLIHI